MTFTIIRYACHLCSERNLQTIFDLRDHWQRDHNYNVAIRVLNR